MKLSQYFQAKGNVMQQYFLYLSYLLASEELLLLPPLLFLLLPPLLLPPLTLLLLLTLRPEFSVSPLLLELKGKHQEIKWIKKAQTKNRIGKTFLLNPGFAGDTIHFDDIDYCAC